MIGEDGRMTAAAGERFAGMTALEAREAVVAALREEGAIARTEPYTHDVPFSHRSGERIEPLISLQWFMRMDELAEPAIEVVATARMRDPSREPAPRYLDWMENIRPVVHLAPALVGPPDPGLVPRRGDLRRHRAAGGRRLGARPRRARHVVLVAALWPFADARLARRTRRSCAPSTRPTCSRRARDILFLWVARMVMFGIEFARRHPVHRRLPALDHPGARRPADVEVARHRDRPAGR